MQNTIKKTIFTIFIILTISSFFYVKKNTDQNVHIVFCDVGQGDAILIYQEFFQVLIDSGVDDRVLTCLNENIPFWDRKIELVIVTHYDNDHIGGFKYVFDAYQISAVLTLPFKDSSVDFLNFEKYLNDEVEKGSKLIKPFLGQKIRLSSGMNFTVLSVLASSFEGLPIIDESMGDYEKKNSSDDQNTEAILSDSFFEHHQSIEDKNNLSISLLFNYKNTKVLLTGDLEEEQEKAVIDLGLITDVDILKVGHHGSKSSSSSDFLKNLSPEIAVISCGKNNKFGHPDMGVLERFSNLGTRVMRTDEAGSIHIVTDGYSYWIDG